MIGRLTIRRTATLGAAALVVLAAGGASLPTMADATRPLIAKADAAALLDATSGEQLTATRATGADALVINASMPFATGAIAAARPFDLPASDVTDYRRALLCMTQAVYYEAGFEPLEGRRAVAQVVLNRMRHPAFPKSVCGVVYQGARAPVCQFSFVCDGSLYRRPALGAWKEAEAVARAALDGFVERSVGGATHYHANYVAPYWAPRLTKLSQIGAHIFYRWPGAWGSSAAFTGRYSGEPYDPASLRPPLRSAVVTIDGVTTPVVPEGPIIDGTVLNRAQNDVGGLLDTTKGWTLNIPMPSETSAATRTVAATQRTTTPVAAAPTGATSVAGL